ncbi:protein PBDC1 [Crotalus adamanteus]|uniref:Protein PBDC1 n=1 Tax=Crotalus adamanteus TaxID=8729 RepID=A0AAW1AZN2_CROAD
MADGPVSPPPPSIGWAGWLLLRRVKRTLREAAQAGEGSGGNPSNGAAAAPAKGRRCGSPEGEASGPLPQTAPEQWISPSGNPPPPARSRASGLASLDLLLVSLVASTVKCRGRTVNPPPPRTGGLLACEEDHSLFSRGLGQQPLSHMGALQRSSCPSRARSRGPARLPSARERSSARRRPLRRLARVPRADAAGAAEAGAGQPRETPGRIGAPPPERRLLGRGSRPAGRQARAADEPGPLRSASSAEKLQGRGARRCRWAKRLLLRRAYRGRPAGAPPVSAAGSSPSGPTRMGRADKGPPLPSGAALLRLPRLPRAPAGLREETGGGSRGKRTWRGHRDPGGRVAQLRSPPARPLGAEEAGPPPASRQAKLPVAGSGSSCVGRMPPPARTGAPWGAGGTKPAEEQGLKSTQSMRASSSTLEAAVQADKEEQPPVGRRASPAPSSSQGRGQSLGLDDCRELLPLCCCATAKGEERESPGEAFQVQGASPAAAPTGTWPAAQRRQQPSGRGQVRLALLGNDPAPAALGQPGNVPPRRPPFLRPSARACVRACMGGLRGGRAKASPRSCAVVLAESPRSAHRGRGRRALPPDPVTSSRCPAVTEQRGQRRGWPEQSGEPDRRSRPGGYPRPQRQAHARFTHHLTLGVKRAEAPGRRGRAGPAATWRQSVAAQPRAFRPNEGGAAHGSLPARPEQPLNIEPSRPAGPPVRHPALARLGKAEERSANAGKGRAKSPASAAMPARATESSARPARTLLRRGRRRDPVGEGAPPTPIERGFPDPLVGRRLSRGRPGPGPDLPAALESVAAERDRTRRERGAPISGQNARPAEPLPLPAPCGSAAGRADRGATSRAVTKQLWARRGRGGPGSGLARRFCVGCAKDQRSPFSPFRQHRARLPPPPSPPPAKGGSEARFLPRKADGFPERLPRGAPHPGPLGSGPGRAPEHRRPPGGDLPLAPSGDLPLASGPYLHRSRGARAGGTLRPGAAIPPAASISPPPRPSPTRLSRRRRLTVVPGNLCRSPPRLRRLSLAAGSATGGPWLGGRGGSGPQSIRSSTLPARPPTRRRPRKAPRPAARPPRPTCGGAAAADGAGGQPPVCRKKLPPQPAGRAGGSGGPGASRGAVRSGRRPRFGEGEGRRRELASGRACRKSGADCRFPSAPARAAALLVCSAVHAGTEWPGERRHRRGEPPRRGRTNPPGTRPAGKQAPRSRARGHSREPAQAERSKRRRFCPAARIPAPRRRFLRAPHGRLSPGEARRRALPRRRVSAGRPRRSPSAFGPAHPPGAASSSSSLERGSGMAAAGPGALGAREAAEAAHVLSLPAEAFGNDPRLEAAWAERALQHAHVYFHLLSAADPAGLRLTRADDRIYAAFRRSFPDLRVDLLDVESLKSEPAKEKWRPFCLQFEGAVEDFNLGTLLRLDCRRGYSEENSVLAPRIQFLAIEIARNREGCNGAVYRRAGTPEAGPDPSGAR